ncbi:MAG: FtsX-like permease family protein [Chrysiogenia bacterium]
MFDLEQSIKKWKRELAANPAMEEGYIAELESHLRDRVEELAGQGVAIEDAFRQVAGAMGETGKIGAEFYKAHTVRRSGRPSWQRPRFMPGLFWNYFKTAARRLRSQKTYSLINILGMAVSLTCVILMLFHVQEELGFEKCFSKAERIYRVQTDSQYGSNFRNWATSAPALGPKLAESFPEIEDTARIIRLGESILVANADSSTPSRFEETNGVMADASFPTMFDLKFLQGDPRSALSTPMKIVLNASLAKKYFPGQNPIGKTLVNESGPEKVIMQVSGVFRDLPRNTHLQIDYMMSMTSLPILLEYPEVMNHRTWKLMHSYVLLRPGQSPDWFKDKAPAFMKTFLAEKPGQKESLRLQPIRSIHLHSKLEGEIKPNSDIVYIYIFSATALLLLLIAGVNFVNLTTAQACRRMKEIGMRKVLGAGRGQLVKQHLGESILTALVAFVCSLGFLLLSLPLYNRISEKMLHFRDVMTMHNALFCLALVLLLGILSGLYPAFIVSGFRIGNTLKSGRLPLPSASRLRKGLVVFQFAVSIFIILGTLAINRQLLFFRSRDLGFDKDKLIAVNLDETTRHLALDSRQPLKNEILRQRGVSSAALVSQLFGTPFSNERLTPVWVHDRNALPMLRFLRVDEDFIKTAGLTLVQGKNFQNRTLQKTAYIISESTQAVLNLKQPLGVKCRSDIHGGEAPIVGVIKDFHFASLQSPIEPLVLEYSPAMTQFLLVKVSSDHYREVLEQLRKKFKEIAPQTLFRYRFVNDVIDQNYEMENRVFDLFKIFAIIAIGIACLGLFGLTALAAESRVKEIGIRKVLGASSLGIVQLLTSEFLRLVLLGYLIACPLAYIAIGKWLDNFAYEAGIGAWTFFVSAFLALTFALLTVGVKALVAARANPVESLKYE